MDGDGETQVKTKCIQFQRTISAVGKKGPLAGTNNQEMKLKMAHSFSQLGYLLNSPEQGPHSLIICLPHI